LEGEALANSADPSFWFNLQHKFPGLQVVARRLLDKFGIVASPYIPEAAISGLRLGGRYWRCNVRLAAEHYPGEYVVKTVGYSVYQHDETIRRRKWTGAKPIEPEVPILCAGQVEYRMRWSLRIADDYEEKETPASYLERNGKMPIAFLDPPGIHPPD